MADIILPKSKMEEGGTTAEISVTMLKAIILAIDSTKFEKHLLSYVEGRKNPLEKMLGIFVVQDFQKNLSEIIKILKSVDEARFGDIDKIINSIPPEEV